LVLVELEREVAFVDDPGFVVGVAVQSRPLPELAVVEDERDRGAVLGACEA
jgi:hypothetical protein